MKIQFYNTLTNQLEEFKPIEPGKVRMYSCGPTVYDFAHIGNFRTFLFGDVLRRFLELAGYDVTHVMNITDVGHMVEGEQDKMELAGERILKNKKSGRVKEGEIDDPNDPYQIAEYYTNAFLEDSRQLGYKIAFDDPSNIPRATDHVTGMQEMIQQLLDRGHAYVAEDGVVYFSVESFPSYGTLSGNTLEHLMSGAGGRVSDANQSRKKHPADFMLWKPDDKHLMKWESPWGTGYPGWHIECSVMASKVLGQDVIDIHTGGEDLIFPHHECEIAQSRGSSGESHFANYWMHARFLFVEGDKMSKSSGTFYTARDVFGGKATGENGQPGNPVDPAVLRYELIKSRYRENMNFTKKGLVDSGNDVRKIMEFRRGLEEKTGGEAAEVDLTHPIVKAFVEQLADDLNIAGALGVVHPWIKSNPSDAHEALGVWKMINSVLSIAPINEGLDAGSQDGNPKLAEAEELCKSLDAARAGKDYDQADEIRKQIQDLGFEVRTTKEGTTIQKQLV